MPQNAGRTGRPGNKAGTKAMIHIRMKDPMIHLRGGTASPKGYTRKKT